MPKMLRHTKTGTIYPMNSDLARHDAMETIAVDKNGKVEEPEAVVFGNAASEEATATDTAQATKKTNPKKTPAKDKTSTDENLNLDLE